MMLSWRRRRSRSRREAASSAFTAPSGSCGSPRQVMTSFFLRRRSLRRASALRKFFGGASGRKKDAVGSPGEGSGRVGFSGSESSRSTKLSGSAAGPGRYDDGAKVGDAGQKGSSVTSDCESAGVGSVEAEDAVDIVDVDVDSDSGGGYVPERLALRELSANDSTEADGGPMTVSVGDIRPRPVCSASVGVGGTESLRIPSEPARPREMKLSKRLRFGLGGEGGVAGAETLGR